MFVELLLSTDGALVAEDPSRRVLTYSGEVSEVLWAPPDAPSLASEVMRRKQFVLSDNPQYRTALPTDIGQLTVYAFIDAEGGSSLFARSDLVSLGTEDLAWVIHGLAEEPLPSLGTAYVCEPETDSDVPPGMATEDPIAWLVAHLEARDRIAEMGRQGRRLERTAERVSAENTFYDEFADDELEADVSHLAFQLAAGVAEEDLDIRRVTPFYLDISGFDSDEFVFHLLGTDGELLGWGTIGEAGSESIIEYATPIPRPGQDLAIVTSDVVVDDACQDWSAVTDYRVVIPRELLTGSQRPLIDASDWSFTAVTLDEVKTLRHEVSEPAP